MMLLVIVYSLVLILAHLLFCDIWISREELDEILIALDGKEEFGL